MSKTPSPTRKPRARKSQVRRKNLNIDQGKLDRVRKVLGVRTETEAVDQALDMILFREELLEGIDRIAGSGGVENFFDADPEP
jgi:Arc/MetJ family transcription regulator